VRIVDVNQPHRIEYKERLTESEWTKLHDSTPMDRRVTVMDATATGDMRFYRIVRE